MVSISTMIAVCCLSIAFNWNSIRVCNICCPVTWCTNTIRLLWCHSWLWKLICSLHCIFLLFPTLSWHWLSDMRPYTCHSCHRAWLGADCAEEGRRDWVSNFLLVDAVVVTGQQHGMWVVILIRPAAAAVWLLCFTIFELICDYSR